MKFGRRQVKIYFGTLLLIVAFLLTGCFGQGAKVFIDGAGASFPYPIYTKWMAEYRKTNPDVFIDYTSIGSSGGIKGITMQTVDFAGTDAPMKDAQLAKAPGTILHIPTVLGAVVVTYNLPGIPSGLKLTPDVLSQIFLGHIKTWNDPRIGELNPDLRLPAESITVIHRSDGSGTTNMFTDYLSKVSPQWRETVGTGTAVEWPTGIGAKGNEGVSGTLSQTPGGIGYVELAIAAQNDLPYVHLQNQAGNFAGPSLESITAAAAGAVADMPDDLRVSLVDSPGENAYPIAGFTYLLVYQDQKDMIKGAELAKFLWWSVHEGEKMVQDLYYAPLPESVVKRVEEKIKQMNFRGIPFIQE